MVVMETDPCSVPNIKINKALLLACLPLLLVLCTTNLFCDCSPYIFCFFNRLLGNILAYSYNSLDRDIGPFLFTNYSEPMTKLHLTNFFSSR